jgi:hypothetical protein
MAKGTKLMVLTLPERDYERLATLARLQVREPEQQASYIVRRAVSRIRAKQQDAAPAAAQ